MAVFVDALPAIEAAMRDLAEGQLIQTEDLNLLQLMGAIEVSESGYSLYRSLADAVA